MRDTENGCLIESAVPSCSFKTAPKGLKQHPIPVAIIHSASIEVHPENSPTTQLNKKDL